jgi:hypothetical protein
MDTFDSTCCLSYCLTFMCWHDLLSLLQCSLDEYNNMVFGYVGPRAASLPGILTRPSWSVMPWNLVQSRSMAHLLVDLITSPSRYAFHLFCLTHYCGSYARSLIESTHSYSLLSLIYNLDMADCLGYWDNRSSSSYVFVNSLQGLRDSGIGSQGIINSINIMCKVKSTVINLPGPSYTMG